MIIYADVLFIINFITSYIILFILGKIIIKVKIKKIRLAISSVVGGVAAVVVFSLELPVLVMQIIRVVSSFFMVFTSFYEKKRAVLSNFLWLSMLSLLLTVAMIFTVMSAGGVTGAVIKSGVIYIDLPLKLFVALMVISYAGITVFMKILYSRRFKRRYIIDITHNGKKISTSALFDSGNQLREPVTGKGVSLIEWGIAKELLGAEFDYYEIEQHAEELRLWAVPYRSVGKEGGVIFAFIADKMFLPDEKKTIERAFIGLYDGSFGSEYHALINAGIL